MFSGGKPIKIKSNILRFLERPYILPKAKYADILHCFTQSKLKITYFNPGKHHGGYDIPLFCKIGVLQNTNFYPNHHFGRTFGLFGQLPTGTVIG